MQILGQITYLLTLAILGVEAFTYTKFVEKNSHEKPNILLTFVGPLSAVVPGERAFNL